MSKESGRRSGEASSLLRLVLVERELLSRAGLERLIASAPDISVTAAVGSVADAVHLPADTAAEIILVGADVADLDNAEGIQTLVARFPSARVVMLGPEAESSAVIAAFRAGASGYLTRNITLDGLARALRGVESGEIPLPRTMVHLLVDALRFGSSGAMTEEMLQLLSPRERDVLAEIACGRSNAEIALRLNVSESTVKTHVSNILRKTGSRSRFALQSSSS